MNTPLTIPANQSGVIRVFALSMDEGEAKALKSDPNALNAALGAEVDAEQVEIFPVSDLEGVGLVGYLAEGNAVPMEDLTPDRAKLDRLGGWVMIVFSRAFDGQATTLAPAPALTLIGTYGAAGVDWRATETVTSEAAKPYSAPQMSGKKRPSDAAMSGRIATIVLILLGLLVWLMVWISG
ncbi:hypothetical protein [uncultured Tateyamaria sp.]|uniref:hypothetical protein n=1 Tax=uncultured Tateyamaria sp. TaxID=455651 RepID=UPI002610A01B|nr:hypothetical protein [uncultured Tateyamaria sp.]